jgi:hypothetical protein
LRRVEYTTLFDEGVRKRHFHERRGKKVTRFCVQLEVLIGSGWKVVVRYDCAHGFSHIDQYWRTGRKKKTRLDLDFEKALIVADWDIKTNWEKYVRMYLGKEK